MIAGSAPHGEEGRWLLSQIQGGLSNNELRRKRRSQLQIEDGALKKQKEVGARKGGEKEVLKIQLCKKNVSRVTNKKVQLKFQEQLTFRF